MHLGLCPRGCLHRHVSTRDTYVHTHTRQGLTRPAWTHRHTCVCTHPLCCTTGLGSPEWVSWAGGRGREGTEAEAGGRAGVGAREGGTLCEFPSILGCGGLGREGRGVWGCGVATSFFPWPREEMRCQARGPAPSLWHFPAGALPHLPLFLQSRARPCFSGFLSGLRVPG